MKPEAFKKWKAQRDRRPKVLARQSKWLNAKIKAVVKRSAETKFRTSNHTEASMSTLTQTPREHTPCWIKGGVKENERIGNDANLVGVDIRGYVHNNSTTDTIHVRAMAIIDRENPGGSLNTQYLLLKDNAPVSQAQGVMGAVYRPNTQRYRVLWDNVMTLSAKGPGNGSSHTRIFKRYLKTNLGLKFNDDNAGSICKNDVRIIFFVCEADGDVILGETVELYSQVIGYYKDL